MDAEKENASNEDISKGKAKITKPFRYVMPQSEIEERNLSSSKGKNKEINPDNSFDQESFNKIIVETMQDDSETVINRCKEILPNFNEDKYRLDFMKAVELEIESGKTDLEKEEIRRGFMEYDLLEIQNTGGTSDIRQIRNVIRENYTHNSLLKEIKQKTSINNISSSNDQTSIDNTSSTS
jgi:hypothetical protein